MDQSKIKNIKYKIAYLDDLPAIKKAGRPLFDNAIKINRAKEFLTDPRHHLVLAYYNDEVVGMVSGFHYVHPDKEPELYINEIAVLEKYQNKQIGRELLHRLIKYSKDLGCVEAWLLTNELNTAARKTFNAAGGTENEEIVKLIRFKY
jgi:ribosomal protein S18 acetylase RimI-like enzyme